MVNMNLRTATATPGCIGIWPSRAPGLRRPVRLGEPRARAARAFAASKEVTQADVAISPEELIELTKDYNNNSVFATNSFEYQAEVMAADYVFRGPAIGPFNKQDYVKSLTKVTVKSAFPDLKFEYWGHSVDPNNPLRVWYFAQVSGTMTKDWDVNGQFFPATNKPIESAPEAHSIEWTPDRKVKYQSVGYCVDRIYSNSPDGSMTVAVFAAFKAAEKPWVLSVLFNPLFESVMALIGKPQATPWENLPEWYRKLPASKLKGSQGLSKV